MGADIDSYAEAYTLGIDRNHAANYEKSSRGVDAVFNSVGRYRCMFSKDSANRSTDWKDDDLF